MKQLMFKARFIPLILNGSKTQTIRARNKTHEGDFVQARCQYHQPAFGILRVTSVCKVKRSELSESDAKADGFETLTELQKTIKQLYPLLAADCELFRIQFEYMGTPERIRGALARQDSLALSEPSPES
jgi:hypothetical protein